MERQAVVVVAHVWSDGVASGVAPFLESAARCGVDAHVLLVGVGGSRVPLGRLGPHVRVHRAAPRDVWSLYNSGWLNGWESNHWCLMWWWRRAGRGLYDRVWSVEYDVRAAGCVDALWRVAPGADYVSSTPCTLLEGAAPHEYAALKQVFALSAAFADALDAAIARGDNGRDETVIATCARRLGVVCASLSDARLLAASWTVDAHAARAVELEWRVCEELAALAGGDGADLTLFHPVK
jgi:hypothetical protein